MRLVVLFIFLGFSLTLLSQELQDAQPQHEQGNVIAESAKEPPIVSVVPECQEMLKQLKAEYSALDSEKMLAFYGSNAPDLLVEWQKRCAASTEKGTEYAKLLIKNFLDIEKFRENSPEEYERLVRQQKTESLIRTTSLEIQNVAKQDNPNDRERLNELKLTLRKLMEDAFDEAQRRQLLEINRLENEVRNLRNLAEQRAANKQSILQQRFKLLTDGQEWPK